MAKVMQIYLVHAEGDDAVREKLTTQARTAKLAVEFTYLPTKQPWLPHWKASCRGKILQSSGAIVLLTKRAQDPAAIKTELDLLSEIDTPSMGVFMEGRGVVPEQLRDVPVIEWNWPEVAKFIQSVAGGLSAHA